jgi:hypothetical protein
VCLVVCEVTKVPKVTYDCECEEICVPGPSIRSTECDDCGHKRFVYTPTCGKLRTRTKMLKHTTYEEKVVYKWVVENRCNACAERCGAAEDDEEPFDDIHAAQSAGVVRPAAHQARIAPSESPEQEPVKSRADDPAKFSIRQMLAPFLGRP